MRKTLKVVAFGGGPADAFIKAAGITDSTQQTAIKTLVNDLNGYGLWTKMKAIYPMVGGNATAHSYNLKDTTKFQITWNGGLTHDSNGVTGNGTNGYGDTNLNALSNLINSNLHLSFYSRTANTSGGAYNAELTINSTSYSSNNWITFRTNNKTGGGQSYFSAGDDNAGATASNTLNGYYIGSETSNSLRKLFRNQSVLATNTTSDSNALPNFNITLFGVSGGAQFSANNSAIVTIGNGLTDTEAANLYTSIQKFQTTLNRFVGTPIYSSFDSDAQSFMTSASITDSTQQAAVNYLVTDLKSNNLWSKMKAIYPMVGGTASTHKFNLKDPRDLDAAFRLVFNGGWTHSSTGALPNGSNAYANTYLSPNSQLSLNNASISYYSRTSGFSTSIMGASNTLNDAILIAPRFAPGVLDDYSAINCSTVQKSAAPNTLGLFTISRIASANYKGYQNGTQYFNSITSSSALTTQNIYIGARNMSGSADQYGNLQCAFATIGDGLSDTEATNLYTIIQNYQTILSRQV